VKPRPNTLCIPGPCTPTVSGDAPPPSRSPIPPRMGRFLQMQFRSRILRVVLLAGVVAAVVVVAGIIAYSVLHEPVYQGIGLNEVLDDKTLWLKPMPRTTEVGHLAFPEIYSARELEHIHALHCMGQAAWPVLLDELQAEDSKPNKLKLWAMQPAVQRFIPIKFAPARRHIISATFLPMAELIAAPGHRTFMEDSTWRGIEEFPPQFRRIVLDLAAALRNQMSRLAQSRQKSGIQGRPQQGLFVNSHQRVLELANFICLMIGRTGTNGVAAIPALEQAVHEDAFVGGAKNALIRISGGNKIAGSTPQQPLVP
jgi:hypothetical protein